MENEHDRVKMNEAGAKWEYQGSGNRFAEWYQEISEEMLDDRQSSLKKPFEVAVSKVPPGKSPWPFHSHRNAWEYYIILSGQGIMRDDSGEVELGPGDHILEPPGVAHQLTNTGDEDLIYYTIADNVPLDLYHYPDSDKWGIQGGPVFRMTKVDYYDGEDDCDKREKGEGSNES